MARDEGELPIDVAVELERARRLGDRFEGTSDGELAREQRARRLSAEFLNHVSLSSLLGKASDGIAQLEESLELQRRKQLKALAEQALLEQAPDAPTGPLERSLQRSLEEISVKNILDFRNSTSDLLAQATATAAVCAVANLDELVNVSIHSLDPEQPWAGAMEVLSKPGHFINTLRRFPQAVSAKKVPEENMVAARHFLQMARGTPDDVPQAVASLQRWIRAAIQLWEGPSVSAPNLRPQRVEVKTREYRSGALRSTEIRPLRDRSSLLSPRKPVQPLAKAGTGPASTRPVTVRQVPVTRSSTGGESLPTSRPVRSKSQDPRPRPTSPRPQERRPVDRSPRPRQMSPRLRPAPQTAPPQPAAPPAPRSTCRAPSARATARPQTARVHPTGPAGHSTGPPSARPMTARPASVTRAPSVRRESSESALARCPRAAPAPRALQSSKSASSLTRGSGTPGSPGSPELPSVEELKRMIEETKKEVREIRQVESKTRWQIVREERRDKLAQTIATQSELRDWRWKQVEGMKALALQRAQEAKEVDLKESKEFVQFKREAKLRSKEHELQYQTEVYEDRKKDSAWTVEKAREASQQEQALVREKVEDVQQLRQEKKQQVEQQKVIAAQERALQEHMDVAHLARQLAAEKERLLENLQFSRSCLQAPLRRR